MKYWRYTSRITITLEEAASRNILTLELCIAEKPTIGKLRVSSHSIWWRVFRGLWGSLGVFGGLWGLGIHL